MRSAEQHAKARGLRHVAASHPEVTMPRWTKKEEREYEHIKDGYEARGTSHDRAQEIAARTVNKQRREDGETPNRRTQGTGNPSTDYEARTRDELENIARDRGIRGRSSMKKAELIDALRNDQS
jgi:plasmid stabilization system protein ParE